MADVYQAVTQYGPKLELKRTAELAEMAEWMAARTGLDKYDVELVLEKVGEGILHFCDQGQPVRLAGLGTFTPTINRIGEIAIDFATDPSLRNSINASGGYRGAILNRVSIGWTNEQYEEAWDEDHTNNPMGT